MWDAKMVGMIIKNCRQSKNMTQEVFSGLAGLDRTHYSKIERGLRLPNLNTIVAISTALEIRPFELVKIIEDSIE